MLSFCGEVLVGEVGECVNEEKFCGACFANLEAAGVVSNERPLEAGEYIG
jgi:hypothetical protein